VCGPCWKSTADDYPVLNNAETVLQVVLSVIGFGMEEFNFERPILPYGLDSVSATRLISILHGEIACDITSEFAYTRWLKLRFG
jgi:hypothetical protein